MNKIYLLMLTAIMAFGSANAAVDKTPQPRKVVLEEFTGIHCGYCPDGHKRATDLMNANKGNVALINIHAGGYAVPGAGEIDLRTNEGTTIDGSAGVTGYPAGSVNRVKAPWATSRTSWATEATAIFAQTSPVNLDMTSSIDFSTRELTVTVEYYYTSDAPASSNKLFVALIQDSILGTQSDYGNYFPTNWTSDKQYIHNHVFRMMLNTGSTSGDAITVTKSGSTEKRTYKVTLPEIIGNVPVILTQLQLVAYVAENTSKIYTGIEKHVEFNAGNLVDLQFTDMTVYPTDICASSINPKVQVKNNSTQAITSFDAAFTIFGKTIKKSFAGNLAAGATTVFDYGTVDFTPSGSTTMTIGGVSNMNASTTFYDPNPLNNLFAKEVIYFGKSAFTNYKGGFDGLLPANTGFDMSRNIKFGISTATSSHGALNSAKAIMFYMHSSWGLANLPGRILFGEADLNAQAFPASPLLSYYYAFDDGDFGGTTPKVSVEYSEDCGVTWKLINTTTLKETVTTSQTQYLYVPKSSEYQKVEVDLSTLKGKKCIFRLSGIPGSSGNALYLDEFAITNGILGGVEEFLSSDLSVNPSVNEGSAKLNFSLKSDVNAEIYMVDLFGNRVLDINNSFLSAGNHSLNINASNLVSGKYFVVTNFNGSFTQTSVVIAK